MIGLGFQEAGLGRAQQLDIEGQRAQAQQQQALGQGIGGLFGIGAQLALAGPSQLLQQQQVFGTTPGASAGAGIGLGSLSRIGGFR